MSTQMIGAEEVAKVLNTSKGYAYRVIRKPDFMGYLWIRTPSPRFSRGAPAGPFCMDGFTRIISIY